MKRKLNIVKSIKNLSLLEKCIWLGSLFVIFVTSAIFPNPDWLSVITSLVGATALIFVGKGDPMGQLVSIIFALFYALVSLKFRYYGEMITYLFMSAPSALWALITWLKNPFTEREVKVAQMTAKKWFFTVIGSIGVTFIMYFVLGFLDTANLVVSTFSITTSFFASLLTVLRSPYYALFYALNDIVLIVLWVLATVSDIGYLPMVFCFIIFLVNDIYGFFNWQKMKRKQNKKPKI